MNNLESLRKSVATCRASVDNAPADLAPHFLYGRHTALRNAKEALAAAVADREAFYANSEIWDTEFDDPNA